MTGIPIRRAATAALFISASALAGCATTSARPPVIAFDDPPPAIVATPAAEPPRAVEIVTIPEPLPLPGQLKPVGESPRPAEPADPRRRIGDANDAARIQPVRDGFLNAIQQYPWTDGALYQVYTAPGQVTDIVLQEGEQLVGPGPVAAGDTVRWIIGDTVSGSGGTARVHILAAAAAPAATGVDVSALNFRYRIEGDRAAWKPVRAFDDGRQVFVEFPAGISQGEMPPLFVTGAAGDAELVNYRVQGRYMVVDRLFAAAELRLGDRRSEQRVRIVRDGANTARRGRP